MPEVKAPEGRVGFREKLIWTGLVVVIFFIMTEIRLFGATTEATDPFIYMRVIFASSRGTLMELGIQPIVTSGLIVQLLASSGIIAFDNSDPEDRALLSGVTKIFSMIMTSFLALAYILSGSYGTISAVMQIAIFFQLFMAGIVIILLDELLQKGWGFGSGMSLFIAAGVAQKIIWNLLCPLVIEEDGTVIGSIFAYVQYLLAGKDPLQSFIYRSDPSLPTMLGLVATIVVFMIVISLESLKIDIPISYARFRGFGGRYPIKFLYISNIPVILVSALFMDIYFVAQIIWSRFNIDGSNPWLNWLGVFENNQPTGGLAMYITSPRNFQQFLEDPIRALIYAGLMIGLCAIFALVWLEVGGMDPRSVAQQLVDSGMQIPGFRRSVKPIQNILERYIPTVTVLGAITVGAVASFSDFFGVYGTGMGILLAVGVLHQLYQAIAKEQVLEMFPLMGRLFG
ncbi:MAG: preprotein translocase subunit SecY [Candidatus Bathyarchaeota archaeon]|nr:MAG: preprotein translocase subunit SecY [Candidatus Bathyarchaeota archaeon]